VRIRSLSQNGTRTRQQEGCRIEIPLSHTTIFGLAHLLGTTGARAEGVQTVEVHRDRGALAAAAAEVVLSTAARSIAERGEFLLCLAGGRTPVDTYRLLASDESIRQLRWERTHVFFGDERCVPPEDDASNYGMAWKTLLTRLRRLPRDHIHRIEGEIAPLSAARAYQAELRSRLGVARSGGPKGGFDLLLLGMGTDGHTASLFPFSKDEPDRWVSASRHPVDGSWRVTLTPTVLNAAQSVRILVAGRDKSQRLAEVLRSPPRPAALPVQRIHPTGDLRWMVDAAAAEMILATRPVGPVGRETEMEVEVLT